METSLHRELKALYAGSAARCEVPLEGFRIDAVARGRLVEVQHASLAAIRQKVAQLLQRHRVVVVKPIIARKQLIQLDCPGGQEVARRYSPKRGVLLDMFHELVYFVRVFPHRNLTIEIPEVEVEESRYAVPARRRRRRWTKEFAVDDQRLTRVLTTHRLRTPRDLLQLLPKPLPPQFDTQQLATHLEIPRWVAQRIAYCLRECGQIEALGKRGRSWWYGPPPRRGRRPAAQKNTVLDNEHGVC